MDDDERRAAWARQARESRERRRRSGRVAVTHWIWPEDRANMAHYVRRLNQRRARARALADDADDEA